jgi:hypothetical protein
VVHLQLYVELVESCVLGWWDRDFWNVSSQHLVSCVVSSYLLGDAARVRTTRSLPLATCEIERLLNVMADTSLVGRLSAGSRSKGNHSCIN